MDRFRVFSPGVFFRTTVFAAVAGSLAACATAPAPELTAIQEVNAAPARPAIDPDALLGAAPRELEKLLGQPSLTRREGRGEFRRYAMDRCNLIVILFPDDDGETRVVHLDAAARESGAEKPKLDDCLAGRPQI